MIPRAFITEWQKFAPWASNEQIEQDLVISRSIVELFSNPLIQKHLAFRGGTALHKLFLPPQIRYSEDIDLVQLEPEPIKPIFDVIRDRLSFLGNPSIRQRHRNNTLLFRFESEIPPVINLRLKIEICCREHISAYDLITKSYQVDSRWFSGMNNITTFRLEELLGTKLRALYQRKKGRDLFDMWYALQRGKLNPDMVIHSFKIYMNHINSRVTYKQYIANMEAKIQDKEFRDDIKGLLRHEVSFDIDKGWEEVKKHVIERLKNT